MSSTPWTIRRASIADLEAIMQIETSVFGTDAWSTDMMSSELSNRNCYYLVARPVGVGTGRADNGGVVDGYAGLLAPHGAADTDIQTIAVAPHARRHGLGRALVKALLDESAERGASAVFLEVRADNPGAQTLYRGLGFDEIGVRPGYYQPDNVDAIVMKLALVSTRPLPVGSGL